MKTEIDLIIEYTGKCNPDDKLTVADCHMLMQLNAKPYKQALKEIEQASYSGSSENTIVDMKATATNALNPS